MTAADLGLASTFTWLAYSEKEQREALDLASTLSEKETRDELGVGSIRDALADRLFPGTSTIQSRARYFFFVPWIFQILERERPGRAQHRADALERRLAATLRSSSDTEGLVGLRTLRVGRLPSSIYWNGLGVLGIRRYALSLPDYYRWLDDAHRSVRSLFDDDGSPLLGETRTIWDDLPAAPDRLLLEPEFALTASEAGYLRQRVERATSRATLLGLLFEHGRVSARCEFPWEYPWTQGQRAGLHGLVREELEVADLFSLGHHGAALMFNLEIARALKNDERIDDYASRLAGWQPEASSRLHDFDLARLWALVPPDRVAAHTRTFVERWFSLIRASDTRFATSSQAAELVRRRERRIKGRIRSRIANPLRVPWNGASGSSRLDFRWKSSVQRMVIDVAEGRARA